LFGINDDDSIEQAIKLWLQLMVIASVSVTSKMVLLAKDKRSTCLNKFFVKYYFFAVWISS